VSHKLSIVLGNLAFPEILDTVKSLGINVVSFFLNLFLFFTPLKKWLFRLVGCRSGTGFRQGESL
jgi:hypothetical protein